MTDVSERRARGHDLRAQLLVVVLAVVAGFIAAAIGDPVAGVVEVEVDVDDAPAEPAAEPEAAGAGGQVTLIAHRAVNGRIDMLAVFGFSDATTGNAVLVPPETLLDVPSLGRQAVADIVRLGSGELLETSIENALGVEIDTSVVLDDAQLTTALAPAAITPDAVSGAASDLGQALPAALESWRTALRDPTIAQATTAVDPRLAVLVERAGAALTYQTLPVESVSIEGTVRYEVLADAADTLMRNALGFALLNGGNPRARVAVRDGTGAFGLTPLVAAVLVPAGGKITSTGNVQGFGVGVTQVVYQDDGDIAAAERLAAALGVTQISRAEQPGDEVDVTVIVGADFEPPSEE